MPPKTGVVAALRACLVTVPPKAVTFLSFPQAEPLSLSFIYFWARGPARQDGLRCVEPDRPALARADARAQARAYPGTSARELRPSQGSKESVLGRQKRLESTATATAAGPAVNVTVKSTQRTGYDSGS